MYARMRLMGSLWCAGVLPTLDGLHALQFSRIVVPQSSNRYIRCKGACMPFTVEEFRDLVRLLEERPEWREELRRLVLTPALLALPEQIAELRARSEQQFQELVAAQQRTEARVDALATAQQR